MLIAIASTDGKTVNEHFGRAEQFLIFKAHETALEFVATRKVTPFSDNDKPHAFNPEKFQAVSNVLSGCQKVFVSKIGDKPAQELKNLGIEPVVYQGLIAGINLGP